MQVWFTDSRYWWLGCTKFPPCNLPVSRGVLLFYCAETGFYIQAIHFLAFHEVSEPDSALAWPWTSSLLRVPMRPAHSALARAPCAQERRKDWLESMIHHIVTTGLLAYSYGVNFTRTGVVVILIHDVSDIFLEAAKLARYSGHENDIGTVFFVIFFLSWVVCRCVIFPAFVIRSTLFEPVVLVAAYLGIEPRPHWEIFNGLLLVLFVLHIYWTYLIFQVRELLGLAAMGFLRRAAQAFFKATGHASLLSSASITGGSAYGRQHEQYGRQRVRAACRGTSPVRLLLVQVIRRQFTTGALADVREKDE
jgi:hypothetical protein